MKILLTVYCITGCDTTSGFNGKGKKKVFNLFMKYAKTFQNLHDIGEQLNLQKLQKDACEKFVALLYGNENLTLNEIRRIRAATSAHPKALPPTRDSFYLHCLRCLLQLWIWHHSLVAKHDLPSPTLFGYHFDSNNNLVPTMMNQPIAAPELLNDLM
ncbi:hypothetical protein DPMN_061089 [Dreissena polymorpha]|uniref:Uncharacterized protein n=1 Tax=Dreissena polymorpha TaxID=45954 RepID=A0A9D4C6D3_DREPO|nr:hypothetical protein DPMN_061089 [Dreissena polymorpha]